MATLAGGRALVARRLPVLLTGLYTWAVTVAPGVWGESKAPLAAGAALGALACLIASSLSRSNLWSVVLGIEGYFACCAFGWWALRESGHPAEPGVFGVLGWVAYTLGWGVLSRPGSGDEHEQTSALEGAPLSRERRRPVAVLILLCGMFLIPLLLTGPLLIERDEAAVLSLVLVLSLLLLLLGVGAEVGVGLFASSPSSTSEITPLWRLRRSAVPAMVLFALLIAGYWLGLLGEF